MHPTFTNRIFFPIKKKNLKCCIYQLLSVKENLISQELVCKRKKLTQDKKIDMDVAVYEMGPFSFLRNTVAPLLKIEKCHFRFSLRDLGVKSVFKIHVSAIVSPNLQVHTSRTVLFCVAAVKILSNFYCQEKSE